MYVKEFSISSYTGRTQFFAHRIVKLMQRGHLRNLSSISFLVEILLHENFELNFHIIFLWLHFYVGDL